MRKKINATDDYNRTIVECGVNSIIAMCVDYATSFTVYRHDNWTHIEVSFDWIGEAGYKSYSISIYHTGTVRINDEEYVSYNGALESLVKIFTE